MSLDNSDRNIRSRIYTYESDVPDHMWNAIDQQLRPRRKRWFYWILLPALFLGAVLLASDEVKEFITPKEPSKMATASSFFKSNSEESAKMEGHNVATSATELTLPDHMPGGNELRKTDVIHPQTKTILPISKEAKRKEQLISSWPPIANPTIETRDKIGSNTGVGRVRDKATPEAVSPGQNESQPSTSLLTQLEGRLIQALWQKDPDIDICPSFSTKLRIHPFVEFGLSGGLPFKTLSLRDQELKPYQDLRENTEKTRSSITLQALAGLDIGDKLEVKAGLGFTRIFEVFDYIDQSATRTITITVIDTILVNGIPTIRTDTSTVTKYGQRIKLSQNRYSRFDIPLLAAYKFDIRHHRFFIQAGMSLNIALKTKGDILATDEQIISIDTKDRSLYPVFKSQTGFDIIGAVGYEYPLKENNALRIMASFRHSLSDITIEDYPLGQRYDHIQLGISWKHQF